MSIVDEHSPNAIASRNKELLKKAFDYNRIKSLFTVASRVLMTWLYNNTGKSVFCAVLYHDISNVSWRLFPNDGSHWDPRGASLILAFAAAIVTVVWGPRTLPRLVQEPEK